MSNDPLHSYIGDILDDVEMRMDLTLPRPANVKPVEIKACWRCQGFGWVADGSDFASKVCPVCDGRMRLATEGGEV